MTSPGSLATASGALSARRSAVASIRGLYAITPNTPDTAALINLVRAASAHGARIIQYRNKSAAPELRLEQARALAALCDKSGAWLIVNDYAELARAVSAHGVHVGAEDADVAQARAVVGPRALVGVSCYNDFERARRAQEAGADYVAFGSFYPSATKPGAVRATLDLLQRARAELALPVVAIGGITVENAPRLIAAGADAIAVSSALFNAADVALAARRFSQLFT